MRQIIKAFFIRKMPIIIAGKHGGDVSPFGSIHSRDIVIESLTESLNRELGSNKELLASAIRDYVILNDIESLYIEIRKHRSNEGYLTNITVKLIDE